MVKWQGYLTWIYFLKQTLLGAQMRSSFFVTKHKDTPYQALDELQSFIAKHDIEQERIRAFKIYSIPKQPFKWDYNLPQKLTHT